MKWYIDDGFLNNEGDGALFEVPDDATEVVVPEGVTEIGFEAFKGCKNVARIALPDSLRRIHPGAFQGCSGLQSVNLPDGLEDIAGNAFDGCEKFIVEAGGLKLCCNGMLLCEVKNPDMERCDVPSGVRHIAREAFGWRLSRLSVVSLPDSILRLNDCVFTCGKLQRLTIHSNIQRISPDALRLKPGEARSDLRELTIIGPWNDICTEGFKRVKVSVLHTESIDLLAESKRVAAAAGFAEDDRGTSTPEGQAYCKYIRGHSGKIMETAFEHPALLRLMCRESLILPRCLDAYLAEAEKRGDVETKAMLLEESNAQNKAVNTARSRKTKKLEGDVETVVKRLVEKGENVGIAGMRFALAGKLFEKGVDYPQEMNREDIARYLNGYGAELVTTINAKTDALIVGKKPEANKLEKAETLGIERWTHEQLTEKAGRGMCVRTIKNGRLEIGAPSDVDARWAFASNAKELTLPEGILEIGDYAFAGCKSLERIHMPMGLRRIGECAFYQCGSLEELEFPSGLESIGRRAFFQCSQLKSARLPEGLKAIGEEAFAACSALKAANVPGSVETLEACMFLDDPLETVHLGEGVTCIREGALEGCANLRELELPQSLIELANLALWGCKGIRHLTIGPNLERCGKDVLMHVKEIGKLTVRGKWSPALTALFKGIAIEQICIDDATSLPSARRRFAVTAGEG